MPFSFIAPSQPSPALARLQATLQGRVVAQVEQREIPSAQPVYTQIFPSVSASTLAPPTLNSSSSTAAPQADIPAPSTGSFKAVSSTKVKKIRPLAPDYAERSWVSDLTAAQAIPLAANLAGFLANQFDPETTTLLLAKPSKKQGNNPFTPELEARLQQAGFTLAATQAEAPQAQLVRYQINALGSGILVQLQTRTLWVSRYYPFNATQALMATSPFSIRILGGMAP